jgi:DNA-binding MarR family transcriptional regulator
MIKNRINKHTAKGAALTELILAIFAANGRLLRFGDDMGRDLSITSARWQVMGAVQLTPKTVAQIARDFELTRQGVLWVTNTLTREGFVELIDNPEHRRAKLVQQTAKGRATHKLISRRQVHWINDLGELFKLSEVNIATAVVKQLSEAIKVDDRTFSDE